MHAARLLTLLVLVHLPSSMLAGPFPAQHQELPVEEFVAAVLASIYPEADVEGARAVAVAIRTAAVRASERNEVRPYYDALSTVETSAAPIPPAVQSAVDATRGEVLAYENALIEAPIFVSSGGHTADNEKVWDVPALPYLRAKPDPFDDIGRNAWRAEIGCDSIVSMLSSHYELAIGEIRIDDRSRDGRVRSVALELRGGEQRLISGVAFGEALNRTLDRDAVPSTNFTLRREDTSCIFEGVGIGPGVGLPLWGARGMSQRGKDYRSILSYYFSGAQVVHISALAGAESAGRRPQTTSASGSTSSGPAQSAEATSIPSQDHDPSPARVGW